MKNPFKSLSYHFGLQSAIDAGFAYKRKPLTPLSPAKRKKLMEDSSLTTPRSKTRAILGVLAPYVTKAPTKEQILAATLLASSLYLNKFSVSMMVDFGNWVGALGNTVVQLVQTVAVARPDIIGDIIGNYPLLQDMLGNDQLLNEMMMQFPDVTKTLYDPQFQEIIKENEGLKELLQKNPTMEDLFMQYPGFAEKVSSNPELLEQLSSFREDLGGKLRKLPGVIEKLSNLVYLSGGAFVENTFSFFSTTFNSAVQDINISQLIDKPLESIQALKDPWNEKTQEALSKLWNSKDMATIALKFTGSAIASYKATQYLVLRWRSWSTGYYTSKYTMDKAFARIKSRFTNIDNPGQRLQEDPEKFTGASVSLLTGAVSAGLTLEAFSGMLWGMGPVAGVPGGFMWIGVAYAATLLGLTTVAGHNLPGIYRNKQRVEANLRRTTDSIHNNAEQIALKNSESTEKDLVKKRVMPVMQNSLREIGAQVKLIVVDATMGNLSVPLPKLVVAFAAVASGTASMGTVGTLNYAFNRVNSALSFLVGRFEQISNWIATAQRMYGQDKATDAAHYIEFEKQQANLQLNADQHKPTAP